MSFRIALNFEDGITRFIDCGDTEKVLDAAYRNKINLPMDCADGVCGTCKCHCESGKYDLGSDYIEDALTEDEAAHDLVLTCQMVPSSDCVIAVPLASSACKTAIGNFNAVISSIKPHSDAALELLLETDESAAPIFLPGQYVNIAIPGANQTRSYSFSSAPGATQISFLVKRVPGGLMSAYLDKTSAGERLTLSGPQGSFYLRAVTRPLLMLAGGTGLAPFLSMLAQLGQAGCDQPIHLIYGVTRGADLVLVEQLEAFKKKLPLFTFDTCVAEDSSGHPKIGYVTEHLDPENLHDGNVDVYLCGPPPMVEAVRRHFEEQGVKPASFHYEKFTPNTLSVAEKAA